MKVADFNNTWCEATVENYNALITLGNKFTEITVCYLKNEYKFFNNGIYWDLVETFTIANKNLKQIHLVDGEFHYMDNIVAELNETWYEEESNGKEMEQNSFNKFGFETPEFEGEILKQVSDRILIGYVINNKGNYTSQKWSITGASQDGKYNLTKIKKEWYEKDENVNKFIYFGNTKSILHSTIDETGFIRFATLRNGELIKLRPEQIRPATKEEVLSLLIEK